MRVFCYYNLHKSCFSIKALSGPNKGRVVKHLDLVYLKDVIFKVSEAGRQRVLATKRKNVHAGVIGELLDTPPLGTEVPVAYDPYKYNSFVNLLNGSSIVSANGAILINKTNIKAVYDT